MSATLIDGKAFAERTRERIARDVTRLKAEKGVVPGLAVVLVGDDPASRVYVASKERQAREAGFHSVTYRLSGDVAEAEVLKTIADLNADPAIHGILVQLPLPEGIDSWKVILAIDPDKDVDGFHPVNAGRLSIGLPGPVPCTPKGCMMLLEDTLGDISGKSALVIGRSTIVGKPMAMLLLAANATVTIAHSRTRNLAELGRQADILVAAVGKPHFVQGDWIKPGAVVLDVGINRLDPTEEYPKGRLVGDVDFEAARAVAGAITPVPGGIGPMTIACLLDNTLAACQARLETGSE
ncbi:bifunctional methylenetetrahydrofolate dehydrogenase/methenyltetrahydrofolate cyclohydrolase FolD [Phaeovibrio sulfidiphilus]|uniref:Bifunctional protein FolD n=1 Tax=Phaeovibrio sulfidiphilus TaxID=1220600 RepID=A0A8J6YQ63_9PROT|nr:bifunctional methylenetetrahydrofolate dehydrogenase/methenyltetrahydrofolate cyclohydrolase FolD [Phaeovibrio sulfidiphilus]MBE1237237.1 bifunctional methylenetetrahydrofolate dehydrogenase/methenyltetrahydrofolate cyclohydrolase FolD [Phaeovibrio sulfidiphilus]